MGALEVGLGRAGWMRGWEATLERAGEALKRVLKFQEQLASAGLALEGRVHWLEEPWKETITEQLQALEEGQVGRKDREVWYKQVVDPIHDRLCLLENEDRLDAHERELVSLSNMLTDHLRREPVFEVYPQKPEELAVLDAAVAWALSQGKPAAYVRSVDRLLEAVLAYREVRDES